MYTYIFHTLIQMHIYKCTHKFVGKKTSSSFIIPKITIWNFFLYSVIIYTKINYFSDKKVSFQRKKSLYQLYFSNQFFIFFWPLFIPFFFLCRLYHLFLFRYSWFNHVFFTSNEVGIEKKNYN